MNIKSSTLERTRIVTPALSHCFTHGRVGVLNKVENKCIWFLSKYEVSQLRWAEDVYFTNFSSGAFGDQECMKMSANVIQTLNPRLYCPIFQSCIITLEAPRSLLRCSWTSRVYVSHRQNGGWCLNFPVSANAPKMKKSNTNAYCSSLQHSLQKSHRYKRARNTAIIVGLIECR